MSLRVRKIPASARNRTRAVKSVCCTVGMLKLRHISPVAHFEFHLQPPTERHCVTAYVVAAIFLTHAMQLNPLKPELNPICYLLALLGAHHFLHVSRIGVKLLTLR